MVKNLLAMRETWVRSLSWEDPLKEGMATHSSILAWRIPMDRGTWQATSMGSKELDTTEHKHSTVPPPKPRAKGEGSVKAPGLGGRAVQQ